MDTGEPDETSTGRHGPRDTDAESHRVQMEALRRIGPSGRLGIALKMSDEARTVAMAGIAARHPEYTPQQVRWALFRKLLGHEIFTAAWPGADELEP